MRLDQAIASRRSVRRFARRDVPARVVRELIALACTAPAPHHTRPWRFVHIASAAARERLAQGMAAAWRADLEADGRPPQTIDRLSERSRRQLLEAPVLLLACLSLEDARPWPDERRRLAERDMFLQSLGAALQNIMLAAHARGLGSYLKGAPLFCPQAVARALDLPSGWQPAFLVLLGHPEEGFVPPPRPEPPVDEFLIER